MFSLQERRATLTLSNEIIIPIVLFIPFFKTISWSASSCSKKKKTTPKDNSETQTSRAGESLWMVWLRILFSSSLGASDIRENTQLFKGNEGNQWQLDVNVTR